MALVVFETICVLACGFCLYVLQQWRREGKGKTAFRLAAHEKSRWRIRNGPLNVVSFRREANGGEKRASGRARGVGERDHQMKRVARVAVSANGWRTSGLQGQGSRGEEDRGKAVEVTVFHLRPLV